MPEVSDKRPLKVFLCHASVDKPRVRELYRTLKRRGVRPWLDAEDLIPGQNWEVEIPKALLSSDAIIICLTPNSVDKEGYVQKEIKFALDKALEMPEGRIFLIPAKLEECDPPFGLRQYQAVNLYEKEGYIKLMKALKLRASQLERATVELPQKDIEEEKPALEEAAREKQEREAAEKAEREKAEKTAREKLEREAAEKAKREKAEREAAEKAARQKAKRDAAEKAKRKKAERRTAQIVALKETLSKSFNTLKLAIPKAMPFLRIGGIIGIILVLFWVASWATPKLASLIPTAKATATLHPRITITLTHSPVAPTSTLIPVSTPTKTRTASPTALPREITDAKGVSMVLVPAGEFTMGGGRYSLRKVELGRYYIDAYEVTNAQYQECVSTQQCDPPSHNKLGDLFYYGFGLYDSYPVVWVTKEDAEQYCGWRGARLPTEEEWEKAARGGDQRSYPWGNQTDLTLRANGPGSEDGFEVTAPVGSFPLGVSPYGAFDMAGNVSEFISDNFEETLPLSKGGDWNGSKYYGWDSLLSYETNGVYPRSNGWTGFRCVRDANP